jgi:hypothetical protein
MGIISYLIGFDKGLDECAKIILNSDSLVGGIKK